MKTWILATLGAVSVGGAAMVLMGGDAPQETVASGKGDGDGDRTRARADRRERSRDGSVEDRVAALEDEVDDLRRELGRQRMGAGARLPEARSFDEGDEPPDGPLADQVRAIVEEEREAEQERRQEQRRERWAQRTEERLDELVARAGLSPEHRESISALWTTEREQMMAMFQEARAGDRDFGEIREALGKLRETTDQEAQALLSEEQYAAYQDLRPRGPGGGGGRGRGRGPGGGG